MPPSPAVRILYVRHGENLANTLHQLSHQVVDHPLTDRGRDQADQLAVALAEQSWPFDQEIVSSPSLRAHQTASVLAAKLGLRVTSDSRLREIDVGSLDGRQDREAWEAYAEIHRRWAAGEWSRRFPEGENLRILANRLRGALLAAAATAGGRPETQGGRTTPVVVVVGHGGGFRAALPYLVSNVADAYPHAEMGTCSVTYLRATPASRPSVLRLGAWGLSCADLGGLQLA